MPDFGVENRNKFEHSSTKTANYTATLEDFYIPVDSTTASFTVTLPTAVNNKGLTYIIYKTQASNTVTIDGDGAETINGVASVVLSLAYEAFQLISNGTGWTASGIILNDSVSNSSIISNAAIVTTKLADSSNFVLTTRTNTFGDFDQFIRDNRFRIYNPADTFSITVIAPAIIANRNLTIPLLTGNDTLVTEEFAQTLTNKVYNTTDNTLTATSQATGDILTNNGTKFVRKARGTTLQVLRTNSGATDVEWASLDSERTGKALANGNASTTIFNIAHGLGAIPSYAFVDCSSHAIARTWTVDTTNIIVTFASAPPTGTNNVIIYWRVVA